MVRASYTSQLSPSDTAVSSPRVLSLDFMRGLIMVLLALESTRFFDGLYHAAKGNFMEGVLEQFFHHPWHGLRFWDLIQPGFMYISGVALALSILRQQQSGIPATQSFKKLLIRCGWLFFLGVLNYAVQPEGLQLRFTNVLTQLSFTLLVAFLIFRWSATTQIMVSVILLILAEALYRFTGIAGFDQPFTNQHNFGNYMEFLLTGRINAEGWVAINCIPTAVHTIAGSLTGKLLMSDNKKLMPIVSCGLACLVLGVGLNMFGITPVIKRIATSSFTLVSLGICLWAYAFCYWWIDIKQHRKHLEFFTIVGMNSIFIYLFFEIVGSRWFNGYVFAITGGVMELINMPLVVSAIVSSLCIFALEWGLCYFLYKKRIFLKV